MERSDTAPSGVPVSRPPMSERMNHTAGLVIACRKEKTWPTGVEWLIRGLTISKNGTVEVGFDLGSYGLVYLGCHLD